MGAAALVQHLVNVANVSKHVVASVGSLDKLLLKMGVVIKLLGLLAAL